MTRDLDALGPFFAVATHQPGSAPAADWKPATELVDAEVLTARVGRVRQALAAGVPGGVEAVDTAVAASVAHLGVAARLIAPMVGARALGGSVPMRLADVWWRDELGGPFPLSLSAVGDAVAWEQSGPVAVTTAFAGVFGVSPKVLSGNLASAANSAARLIAQARPELSDAARLAADEVLAQPDVEAGALRAGPDFRRNSCCLIYRVTGDRTAVCGDCVLR